jgi:hypothetical protein
VHERRNLVVTVLLGVAAFWALFAWLIAPDYWPGVPPSIGFHRAASLASVILLGLGLWYGYSVEDRLDDKLATVTAGRYFEREGMCFAILPRVRQARGAAGGGAGTQAEISLYYQNRYSGPCEAVIHLRPPEGAFFSHKGARDVHFAFRCEPGAFGVVHQPVGVPERPPGEIVKVQVAAAVRWPRGKGEELRRRCGEPVGTFDVDWALAYRQSEHELGGEIELKDPASVPVALPEGVQTRIERGEYVNEVLAVAG